jgi:hypothetical protein
LGFGRTCNALSSGDSIDSDPVFLGSSHYVIDGEYRMTGDFDLFYYNLLTNNPHQIQKIFEWKAHKIVVRLKEDSWQEMEALIDKFTSFGILVELEHSNNEIMPSTSILLQSAINEIGADLSNFSHEIEVVYAPYIRAMTGDSLMAIKQKFGTIQQRHMIGCETKIKIGQVSDLKFYNDPFYGIYITGIC